MLSMSLPFAMKNAKIVGVVLLITSSMAFALAFATTNGVDIIGYVLMLVASLLALRYKDKDEEKKKKKRKALLILIKFLEKVNTLSDWNERLHKLRSSLKGYEKHLPDDIRRRIELVAEHTDIQDIKALANSKLEEVVKAEILLNHHSIGSTTKVGAAFLFSVLATVGIGYPLMVNKQPPDIGYIWPYNLRDVWTGDPIDTTDPDPIDTTDPDPIDTTDPDPIDTTDRPEIPEATSAHSPPDDLIPQHEEPNLLTPPLSRVR